jgi:acetylornithine deacetylase/succinyl-diaminopimelate desuccinylase-like protein
MDDIRAIARAPHPTGSAENRRVRDYLIARLEGMGLEVRTSDGEGVIQESFHERYGRSRPVSNIVAVLPGRERRLQAVTLMSHYDARDLSPGRRGRRRRRGRLAGDRPRDPGRRPRAA